MFHNKIQFQSFYFISSELMTAQCKGVLSVYVCQLSKHIKVRLNLKTQQKHVLAVSKTLPRSFNGAVFNKSVMFRYIY